MLAGFSFRELAGMSWWMVVATILAIIIGWLIKSERLGVKSFGPGDRGYRERFGRPGKKMLGTGPHFHVVGVNHVKMESILPITRSFALRFEFNGKVTLLQYRVVCLVMDDAAAVYRAIYGTFNAGRVDTQNPQRLEYVDTIVAGAIRKIVKGAQGGEIPPITVDTIRDVCGDVLLATCGTLLLDLVISEDAPAGEQIIGSAIKEGHEIEAKARIEAARITAIATDNAASKLRGTWPVYPSHELLPPKSEEPQGAEPSSP